MSDETYEALKRLVDFIEVEKKDMHWEMGNPLNVDIDMVNSWISETAKEHYN